MSYPPIIADSSAPEGSTNYTTIVLFHGYVWTSGKGLPISVLSGEEADEMDETDAFRKMLPFAKAYNSRLILADRRDYHGAIPYTVQERADLFTAAAVAKTESGVAQTKVLAWMRDRAREVYDLLVHIVRQHEIPLAHPVANVGGAIVGGWSFGVTFVTALLANMVSFPVGDVDLRKYLCSVVFLGAHAPFHLYCAALIFVPSRAHPLKHGQIPQTLRSGSLCRPRFLRSTPSHPAGCAAPPRSFTVDTTSTGTSATLPRMRSQPRFRPLRQFQRGTGSPQRRSR